MFEICAFLHKDTEHFISTITGFKERTNTKGIKGTWNYRDPVHQISGNGTLWIDGGPVFRPQVGKLVQGQTVNIFTVLQAIYYVYSL